MPLPPYSNGIPNPLSISRGGTGSATQNFMDLSSPQTIGGNKTFTGATTIAPTATSNVSFTINAPSGQSVDIFDVELNGIKEFYMNSGGTIYTHNFNPAANNTYSLGASPLYWSNVYATRLYLNSTAYLDGGTAGQLNATGVLGATNGLSSAVTSKSSAYNISTSDSTILVSGTTTVTLPTAVGVTGRQYVIKNIGTNTVTIATTSSQNIDGATTYSMATQYQAITVQSDGTQWWVI
jgi:hypothetical protein